MKLKEGKKMEKEIIGLTDMCNSQKVNNHDFEGGTNSSRIEFYSC